jgi:hypothetical protein
MDLSFWNLSGVGGAHREETFQASLQYVHSLQGRPDFAIASLCCAGLGAGDDQCFGNLGVSGI